MSELFDSFFYKNLILIPALTEMNSRIENIEKDQEYGKRGKDLLKEGKENDPEREECLLYPLISIIHWMHNQRKVVCLIEG